MLSLLFLATLITIKAQPPQQCGGLQGLLCQTGTCRFAADMFQVKDADGTCCTETRNTVCSSSTTDTPVCCKDGKGADLEYSNACEATKVCAQYCADGACASATTDDGSCGGAVGKPCADGETCQRPDGSSLGSCCSPQPNSQCSTIHAPVCCVNDKGENVDEYTTQCAADRVCAQGCRNGACTTQEPKTTGNSGDVCPSAQASPGAKCNWQGSCAWGSETCCGETHDSFVCDCVGGEAVCHSTDACMAPCQCGGWNSNNWACETGETCQLDGGGSTIGKCCTPNTNGFCPLNYAPVCCKDDKGQDKQFSNQCAADLLCAQQCTSGPCTTTPPKTTDSGDVCPTDQPSAGADCRWTGSCAWGSETCCGETYDSVVCECDNNGKAVCRNTDACFGRRPCECGGITNWHCETGETCRFDGGGGSTIGTCCTPSKASCPADDAPVCCKDQGQDRQFPNQCAADRECAQACTSSPCTTTPPKTTASDDGSTQEPKTTGVTQACDIIGFHPDAFEQKACDFCFNGNSGDVNKRCYRIASQFTDVTSAITFVQGFNDYDKQCMADYCAETNVDLVNKNKETCMFEAIRFKPGQPSEKGCGCDMFECDWSFTGTRTNGMARLQIFGSVVIIFAMLSWM